VRQGAKPGWGGKWRNEANLRAGRAAESKIGGFATVCAYGGDFFRNSSRRPGLQEDPADFSRALSGRRFGRSRGVMKPVPMSPVAAGRREAL
jgi:hypothetical protein